MSKRCLVVDDNPETVEIVTFILQKAGFEVYAAFEGQKGYELAIKIHPDIILLDIMMPVIDGLTMNKMLKDETSTREIPVIIMSARSGMEPMFDKTKGSGVRGYMVKPFSKVELLKLIEDVLRGGQP